MRAVDIDTEGGAPTSRIPFLSTFTFVLAIFAEALTIYAIVILHKRHGLNPELYGVPVIVLLPLLFALQAYRGIMIPGDDKAEPARVAQSFWRLLITVLMVAYAAMVAIVGSLLPYLRRS